MIQRNCAYQPKDQDEPVCGEPRALDRLHVSLGAVLYTRGLRGTVRPPRTNAPIIELRRELY